MTDPNPMLDPTPAAPATPATPAGVSVALAERAPHVSLFRKLASNPVGLLSMIILALVLLSAIFAPLLAPADPNAASIGDVLGPAAPGHPLGFDSSGRDVLSRLLFAGRFSLAGALLALAISLTVGTLAGLFAGYYGKWFDSVSTWLAGMLMALPAIMVLLAARAAAGPSMWIAMAVFGVIIAPAFFRLTYTLVRGVREELYVDTARVSGLSDGRIITRHILTVVRAPVIIQSAIILGVAIAVQAGLEFLGLSDTTIPTWGNMLNDGFANIYTNVSLVLWPTLVIALVCFCLTLLANVMRDVLERKSAAVARPASGVSPAWRLFSPPHRDPARQTAHEHRPRKRPPPHLPPPTALELVAANSSPAGSSPRVHSKGLPSALRRRRSERIPGSPARPFRLSRNGKRLAMSTTLFLVSMVIITALFFDFTNGFHDSANAMATSVATGALKPKVAVLIAAVLNVAGAFLSTEVAKTISGGIVNDALVTPTMIFAGLVGAILWNLVTWLLGLPSSSSHALFGGLIGAVLIGAGVSGVNFSVVISKIVLPAVVAPVVAGLAAGAATFILYVMIKRADKEPQAGWYRHAQSVSASMVALAHGTSDGQKTMGVITLVLITAGYQESGTGPQVWVIATAGLAIGLGTYSGGWRIMRTMGKGIVDVHAPQGFAAETTSAAAILASSHMGFGLSTTQVCSGSIIGSGVGKKLAHVRWTTARKILYGWLLTLPAAALVGGVAAAIALTGTIGLIIVFAALLAGAGAIYAISKRAPVSSSNVNDSPDVTINPEKAPVSV